MPDITRTRIDCATSPNSTYTITGLDADVYNVEITFHDVAISNKTDIPIIQLSEDGGSTYLSSAGDYHLAQMMSWPGSPSQNTLTSTIRPRIDICKRWTDPSIVTWSGFVHIAGTGKLMMPVYRVGSISQVQSTTGPWIEGGSVRSKNVQNAIKITTNGSATYTTGSITILVYRPTVYDQIIFKDYDLSPSGPFTVSLPASNCEVDVVFVDINRNSTARYPVLRFTSDGTSIDSGTNYMYHRQSWLIAVGADGDTFGSMTTSNPGFVGDSWDGWFKIAGAREASTTLWRGVQTNRGAGYNVEFFSGEHRTEVANQIMQLGSSDGGNFDVGQLLLYVTGDSSG